MLSTQNVNLARFACIFERDIFRRFSTTVTYFQLPSKDRKELRLEVLKEAAQLGVNLYEEHKRFVMSIDPQWRADENVMLLLSAIALFTPERSNVVHKDVIKFEQVRQIIF